MSMASPQWKNYQAPVQDPAILAFQRTGNVNVNTNSSNYGNNVNQSPTSNNINNSIRETGIVEKMLHSYGFIQCCDREARLFFHFSEYAGDIGNIKVNDLVEFQMSFDRRTGKPVAVSVIKLEPESSTLSYDIVTEERMTGTVVAEPKNGMGLNHHDGVGRVSYESSGECFFLPFTMEDLESGVKVKSGDEVSFCIATDKSSSSDCGIRATQITRADPSDKMNGQGDAEDLAYRSVKHSTLSPTAPKYSPINMSPTKKGLQKNGNIKAKPVKPKTDKFQGVVCSMKDNFGFIERSDAVKEIFFHYSEYSGNINELMLGDDVEFGIQIRNNKEVATDIIRLPEGTVIFEDVGVDRRRGRVQKTLKAIHGRKPSDPLAGKIVYETVNGPIEIPYGDKDQTGDYTLQPDDLVEFNIATDRRDRLQRATNIVLVEDTFKVNGEKRENGVIVTLKDGYGFIKCAERDARMFFHFSELMSNKKELAINDEVQFTVIQDPSNSTRQIAIRIRILPKGSVQFDVILPDKYIGSVEKEFSAKPGENDPGIIMYDVNGTKQPISFTMRMNDRSLPKQGEKVEFQISESRNQRIRSAVNLRLLNKTISGTKLYGFIATLKENFGFIENAEHDKEVFFHFSNFDGDPTILDLGDEVEYTLNRKTAKASAENIRRTVKGTVSPEELLAPIYDGTIIRCMRIVNPEQDEYPGLVQVGVEDDGSAEVYPYGVTSLADKRDFLQKGDIVKFQLCVVKSSGNKRATNIAAKRNYIRARVDSVKGQFGFLDYEAEEGKKLFFHMTEVHNNAEIQVGDEVEFVVVQNQRNKKYSACSLRKITNYQRPERLMSRLKSVSEDSVSRVTVLRQPKGPDGTKGFSNYVRVPWKSTAK